MERLAAFLLWWGFPGGEDCVLSSLTFVQGDNPAREGWL